MPSDGGALPDGVYEVFVVDVEESERDDGTVSRMSLTVVSGEYKGEVFELGATGLTGSFIDLVGMPGTVTVTDGVPTVAIDD